MAKSIKWPKLACSLGEQLLRLTNLANTKNSGLHSEPIRSQMACSLGEQILRLTNPSLHHSPSEACEHQKFWASFWAHQVTKIIINSIASFRKRGQRQTDRNSSKETLKETHLHQGYLRPTQSRANPKSDLPIQGCNSIANRFALLLPLYVLNLHVALWLNL